MSDQRDKAEAFHALHAGATPLVLFNAWDAGSARTIAANGARAIATGSWSVAASHGAEDGESLALELVLANLRRIVASVDLPVTLDFEGGYAREPEALARNVAQVIDAGAVGINFEDQVVGGHGLHGIALQSRRIEAVREAAQRRGVRLFINARTDLFLHSSAHDEALVDAAIERARAYAQAGANGVFVPGLVDERLIARCCAGSPLPVNVMMSARAPAPARLAALGVARLSHGPGPYRVAMHALGEAARAAHGV